MRAGFRFLNIKMKHAHLKRRDTISELLDLYDKDRNKHSETWERGTPLPDGMYVLVMHVCIINEEGEVLIQKRHPSKKIWPNRWDITCAGAVLSGETSREAAERELAEELGIYIDLSDERPRFTINYELGFDDFFLLRHNVKIAELVLQKDEVIDAKWASQEEISAMMRDGSMIPYFFLDQLTHIVEMEQGAFLNLEGYTKTSE